MTLERTVPLWRKAAFGADADAVRSPELIIHPSSEGHGSGRRGWDFARAMRAFENTAYALSAMPGRLADQKQIDGEHIQI